MEAGVEYFTFVSQCLWIVRRDNDRTYVVEGIFVFKNFTTSVVTKAGEARSATSPRTCTPFHLNVLCIILSPCIEYSFLDIIPYN